VRSGFDSTTAYEIRRSSTARSSTVRERGRPESGRCVRICSVAADIPAGLGYLALGLGFGALDVVVIRNRDRFASIGAVFLLSLIALAMFASAVVEFRR
jgi:hypothetical protein